MGYGRRGTGWWSTMPEAPHCIGCSIDGVRPPLPPADEHSEPVEDNEGDTPLPDKPGVTRELTGVEAIL